MELTNKKALPLAIVKEISELRAIAREIAKENRDVVSYNEEDNIIFRFTDSDTTSDFFFEVTETRLVSENGTQPVEIFCRKKPRTDRDVKQYEWWIELRYFKGELSPLKSWVDIIKAYNEIHLTEAAQIDAAAEKELYDLFDFVDEDAATNAFDTKQQLLLDNALDDVVEVLESKKGEFEVAEIIEEVKDLKAAIPSTTKKDFGQKLSKILVKVKKKSIRLFKFVMEEFLKEMIKKGIENGFPKMLDYFQ
jgi:hypothetical protein